MELGFDVGCGVKRGTTSMRIREYQGGITCGRSKGEFSTSNNPAPIKGQSGTSPEMELINSALRGDFKTPIGFYVPYMVVTLHAEIKQYPGS
jgi:hypothetical protein